MGQARAGPAETCQRLQYDTTLHSAAGHSGMGGSVRVSATRAYTAESQECLQKVPLPCACACAGRRRLSLCCQLRRLKFG